MPTANSWLHVVIRLNAHPVAWVNERLIAARNLAGNQGRISFRRLLDVVPEVLRGDVNAFIFTTDDSGAYPAATITCTQANAAGDSVTFTHMGVAVTVTEGVQFSRGTTDAQCAANLALALRQHPVIGGIATITSATNVVTLTGKLPGTPLTKVVLSTSDATAFALAQFTGGTDPAASLLLQHVWTGRRG